MGEATPAEAGATRSRVQVRKEAQEKRAKALRLAAMKWSYDQIAAECGYTNRGSAHRAVQQALKDIPAEAINDIRRVELLGLDDMERAVMARALNGDLGAIRTMLRIKDHRAKLLHLYDDKAEPGIDAVRAALGDFLQVTRRTVGE